ncbi:MAG: protein translocase subunit SecF [Hyphomonadaceae bacterium]|nr:protein translocase subunit SecF [Hyphomonadaceae bacterium]
MPWPLIKLVPSKTNFKFVRFAAFAAFVSIVAVVGSFASIFTGGFRDNPVAIYNAAEGDPLAKAGAVLARGFNLGIDFRGGTLLELTAPQPIDIGAVRDAISNMGLGDVQAQTFSDVTHAMIRFQTPGANPNEVVEQVKARVAGVVDGVTFSRTEVVGPKVSEELFAGGLIALGLAILLMLIYIWFRFEWQFGLGAVIALFHDTILTLGLFSVFRIEFTLTIIAALLTIIGYSMNDTVVVFDRLRENLRKYKKMPLGDVIDLSTNETLSRTMVTSVTALLASVALWAVGGETLEGFAIAMTFGILIGTYSSIYVAAPAILLWHSKRGREGGSANAAPAAATS